jgi:hypothetical protein
VEPRNSTRGEVDSRHRQASLGRPIARYTWPGADRLGPRVARGPQTAATPALCSRRYPPRDRPCTPSSPPCPDQACPTLRQSQTATTSDTPTVPTSGRAVPTIKPPYALHASGFSPTGFIRHARRTTDRSLNVIRTALTGARGRTDKEGPQRMSIPCDPRRSALQTARHRVLI